MIFIGVRANFSQGAEPSLPEKYFDSGRKKTAMLTCKISLLQLLCPILLVKILDFGHFILLDGMNSVFRLINTRNIFSF